MHVRRLTTLCCCLVTVAAMHGTPAVGDSLPDVQVIGEGSRVTVGVVIALPDSEPILSSEGHAPLVYIHGQHQILPALEDALTGARVGDRKTLHLAPEQAFGPYDQTMRLTVERQALPDDLEVGDIIRYPHGRPSTVLALDGDDAVLDLNHPLAGKSIILEAEVLRVDQTPNGAQP